MGTFYGDVGKTLDRMGTFDKIKRDYDLESMRDRLNLACGTGKDLSLSELQAIRHVIEQLCKI